MVKLSKPGPIIIVALADIVLSFAIRNRPASLEYSATFYNNGLALCWLVCCIAPLLHTNRIVKVTGLFMLGTMIYALSDNLFFNLKSFDVYDGISISTLTLLYIGALWHMGWIPRKYLFDVILLLLSVSLVLFGRNHTAILDALSIGYPPAGRLFFICDILAKVLFAIYIFHNTKGADKAYAVLFLFLTSNWYINESMFDPTRSSISMVAMIVYIFLISAWLLFRYLYRYSRKAINTLNAAAITFHVYLVSAVPAMYILTSNVVTGIPKFSAITLVIATVTMVLYTLVWKRKYN